MSFPTVVIDGRVIVKLGRMWYVEGGDGEMYPVVGQQECNELYEAKKTKGGGRWMKAIYFLGGVQNCKVVKFSDLPSNARYVCDAEGYSVYDAQDWQGTFYAVKA